MILDYDDEGNLVSVEILDASVRVSDAQKVEFQTVEWLEDPASIVKPS